MATERTDAELVALFATRVLGWVAASEDFDPLTSDRYAWAGVDAHPEWCVSVDSKVKSEAGPEWYVFISVDPDTDQEKTAMATDSDRRRALVLACLRAVGEDV